MFGRSLLTAAAVLLTPSVLAVEHAVTWEIPPNPNTLTVAPSDTIIFRWGFGHNVYQLNPADCSGVSFFADTTFCSGSKLGTQIGTGTSGPVTATVPANQGDGTYLCFVCGIPGHCVANQKLLVKVKGGVVTIPVVKEEETTTKKPTESEKGTTDTTTKSPGMLSGAMGKSVGSVTVMMTLTVMLSSMLLIML